MPEVSNEEWLIALKKDKSDLVKYQGHLKTLEKGGKVENLTSIKNAKNVIEGLTQVIHNKKTMLKKRGIELTVQAAKNKCKGKTDKEFHKCVNEKHPLHKIPRKYQEKKLFL